MAAPLFDTYTVHCFFQRWCKHAVTSIDPQANHDEMEAHYREKHYGVHLDIVQHGRTTGRNTPPSAGGTMKDEDD